MAPSPVGRVLTAVDKTFPEGFDQMFDLPEILIIPVSLSGKKGMKAMVEIVTPLSIQAIASFGWRINDTHIIEVAFSDHPNMTTQFLCLLVNGFPDVAQDVLGTEIEDAMDGVDFSA